MITTSSSSSWETRRVTVRLVRLPTASSTSSKPMLVITRTAFAGQLIWKRPSVSVATPVDVPFSMTAAPMTPSPDSSITVPLTVRVCA